ncbi:dihydrofolate reductase [Streptococcus sp. X16XC17]|uniref:dihydrofolate reductase n=1 Tax=unclassified Streptococcus TaxID=2608887 RepID=UPI00066FE882|nr:MULTISPECIES: dihydrofolate reductase [unclassified Streptococcus]TCD46322.1 dihydrofolate reductase [Streptococcus sp. X16XC17]
MNKKISAVWAQDKNGLIGKNQTLPWSLPAELKHFKETTTGHATLMGRVTFDGMDRRILPNRVTLILTRDQDYKIDHERVIVVHTVQEALDWYQKQDKNLYVIGGGQVFSAFESYLDEIILTEIHDSFEGDTYFPEDFDWTAFEEVSSQFRAKDEQNTSDFTVKVLKRREN